MGKKLNERQVSFVREFITDFNATKAAIRVGYSEKTARQISSKMLSNINIQVAIKKETEKKAKKQDITQKQVIDELGKIAFSDITDFVEWDQGQGIMFIDSSSVNRDKTGALKQVTSKTTKRFIRGGKGIDDEEIETVYLTISTHDKVKALELLGKHLGVFEIQDKKDSKEYVVTLAFDPSVLAKKKVKNDD
jgi:phage terminase small subunit